MSVGGAKSRCGLGKRNSAGWCCHVLSLRCGRRCAGGDERLGGGSEESRANSIY